MAARGVTPRPVTLRDFLELGCDSSSDGFRSYPRRPPLVRPDTTDAVLQQQQAPPAPRAEAPAAQQLLRRSPSRSASSLSLALLSSLSRSFSRRIKESFWRRRGEGQDEEEAAYFDDRDSCGFPSPLVSSCSASVSDESEYAAESSEMDVTTTTTTEETTPASERDKQATASTSSSSSSPSTSSSTDHDSTDAADAKKVQPVADGNSTVGRKKLVVEDKQQLSPVSVLDFPFDDDDGEEEGSDAGTCSSPAFQFQRFTPPPDLHGTKQQQVQLLHKIGRYDGGDGVVQGIDPVDLDARFTAVTTSGSESWESGDASTRLATTTSGSSTDSSSSAMTATRHDDDDEAEHQSADQSPLPDHLQEQEVPDDEYRLLARLLEHDAAAVACLDDEVSRVLVLDFFAEGAGRLVIRSAAGRRQLDNDRSEAAAEALVETAAEWLRGAGPQWGIGDVVLSRKAALDDMERSRRWMCVGEEEHDVGADVEGVVVNALLDELVTELGAVLPWWPRGDMAVDEPGCARSLTEC